MCGIIAYLSKNKSAIDYLINGLIILQNRGYDSAGICTINQYNRLVNTKFASDPTHSAIDKLKEYLHLHQSNSIGIAHTRWATHGAKTDNNAHPHIDSKNRIALVHNGIIENYKELKDFLIKNNFTFSSETDTEVIVNLISYYLDNPKYGIWDAINKAITKLQGTWGIAIIYKDDPNNIYICKKGSPLLVAYDNDFTIIASEASAFSRYTSKYIVLRDNEIIKLGTDKYDQLIDYEFKTVEELDNVELTPQPYPHWMLKEIFEQPTTALRAISMGGRIYDESSVKLGGLSNHKETLLKLKNLIIVASGTSYHAGLIGAKFFRYLRCFNSVRVIDASEFVIEDIPPLDEPTGMIVLSQSGETKDVHSVMELAKTQDIIIIGIVNVVGSLIARESDCGIYLNAGREVAVASTKSFTSQVIVLALVAIWFSQNWHKELKQKRIMFIDSLRNLAFNFGEIIKHISTKINDNVIQYLKDKKSMYIMGTGFAYPIACEGALKIKEIAYIHAEGYSGAALKHGPFALIEQGFPIIMIILNDEYKDRMMSTAEQIKARGAYIIVITNIPKLNRQLFNEIIMIPDNGIMTALLAILPMQYISYKIAVEMKYSPDMPKNLAKSVTTY